MSGLSKVIVLDPDARAGNLLQLGFSREGIPSALLPVNDGALELPGDATGLVVVGGQDGLGLQLVRRARALLDGRGIDAPILFAGRGVERSAARAAGADEAVLQPAYLRDLVTIGRLLRGVPTAQRGHLVGSLVEVSGVFTLVRALGALGRSATLTLVRGLRCGEIRFYQGEVTSAQVGMIHGQAALHQLLLWTDARFDFHHEDLVRRHQIPLERDELFADAERFLDGVRESSGGLSPSIVLDQDVPRIQSFGKQIPTEVYGVLRLFDGHRVLADVLEDSAYRVFETLRVAQRALDIGLLRVVEKQPRRASWRTVLGIEEWLVGSERREPAVDSGPVAGPSGPVSRDSGPVRDGRSKSAKKRRKKKRRHDAPVATAGRPDGKQDIDWVALVPRELGAEVGPLAGVVPAEHVSGEIKAHAAGAPQPAPDEHAQPTVVFDDTPERVAPDDAGLAHAQANRAVAETVSLSDEPSHEPSHVAADLELDDTKPERRVPRTTLPGVAVAEPPVPVEDTVAGVSDAVTAPHRDEAAEPALPVELPAEPTIRAPGGVPPPASEALPMAITDEPSDGVIREPISPTDTEAETSRRRAPSDPPVDDRPEDAMGEIRARAAQASEPSRRSEPTILVADLAAIHSAVSAVAGTQTAAPATADAASAEREAPVLEARSDAAAFSELEEAFFRAGHDPEREVAAAPPVESFHDLDEGYRPVGFWERLRGKAPRPASTKPGPNKK